MKENYNAEYFDKKWIKVITNMPEGGDYRYDLRQHGYDAIKNLIPDGSSVFDFACGLGVIDIQLAKEKNCKVAGCDWSKVAIDWTNGKVKGDFRQTGYIFGNKYDFIIAVYFLEHIDNPVEWLDNCFAHTDTVICALPNNFRKCGEHSLMQWESWSEFKHIFCKYDIEILKDNDIYPSGLVGAYKHPLAIFKQKASNKPRKTRRKKSKPEGNDDNQERHSNDQETETA